LDKSPEAFRTISEVADDLEVPKHVLRFWEGKFSQLRPLKRGGGRRYYRPEDVSLLRGIRQLLYEERYTIKGVQRILREQGVRFVMNCWEDTVEGADRAAIREIPDIAADVARSASESVKTGDSSGITRDQATRLRALLAELTECQKLLAAARG
jgi:DNA-binding transcriptional MerR regulator